MAAIKETEMQVDDRIYDLSEFASRHPGGRIIQYKMGQDASEAFHEFHHRMPRAHRVLKTLKSRPAADNPDKLVQDFRKLRADLVEEGLFEPSWLHAAYRIFELVALNVLGWWIVHQGYWYSGFLLLGVIAGRAGWVQHEANHNSLLGVPALDRVVGSLLFGMFSSGSAAWWKKSHNRHHAAPQQLGRDTDLATLPAVAFDKFTAKLGNPSWLRWQAWTFIPTAGLVLYAWKIFIHPMSMFKGRKVMDAAFVVVHYIIYISLFKDVCPTVPSMLLSQFIWAWAQGAYLFTNFALSHTHKEVIQKVDEEDWVRAALLRTTNISTQHPLVNWWMGYLNLQIEHHLFPNMPQFRQPGISARVRALAEKHGIEYDERGYWETVAVTFGHLNEVGQTLHEHAKKTI